MGTWNHGLLDNDAANDGLGDLSHEIVTDIVSFAGAKPTQADIEQVCAAVGVLLQLSSYNFDLESESGPEIVAALEAHAASIESLPGEARNVMSLVMSGNGRELGKRPGTMSAANAELLHVGKRTSPFGLREAALFETKAGAEYVQKIANRCVTTIDQDFDDESNWSDLCREAIGMGLLGVLMVLEPCKVPHSEIAAWRKKSQQGLASLRDEPDDELEFHELYYANLDKVFAVLANRFA